LRPVPGDRVLDCTLGLGGHSGAFLEAIGPTGSLVGLDADSDNLALAKERLAPYGNRADLRHLNFRHVATLTASFDIILADLGLSSPHLDDGERGFSFRADAPLDMRFDRTTGETAAQFLATREEAEIADTLWKYGEIRESRRLARFIKEVPPDTTTALAHRIERALGYNGRELLPRVFQALRIAVNDEMGALESLLAAIPALLAPGGRAGIISFHSLEDRLVKQAFRALTTPEKDPVTGRVSVPARFELLTRKALVPDGDELAENPRSRSAKFRAIRLLPPA
jgi:16S rRNA (cytosine1402-N4)-methyltransferase